jgi:hypothetical protein
LEFARVRDNPHAGSAAGTASLDYGRMLNGSRVPLGFNSAAPQKGGDRVYVNLLLPFEPVA